MVPVRAKASAWIYFTLCILVILDAFVGSVWPMFITVGLIIIYIILQFKNIPIQQRFAGVALLAIGLIAAIESGAVQETLIDGIGRSRIFLLLFFAVAWLQTPVNKSPSLATVRDAILNQPPGRRFLGLSIGIHILGALLNVAAVGLLSPLLKNRSDAVLHRRLCVATMHGFTSASAWSPFYIGMIVVLVAIPTVTWSQIAIQGIAMAAIMILGGWLFDRISYPRRKPIKNEYFIPVRSHKGIPRTIFILTLLISMVMLTLNFSDVSIPVALGLTCPPFGLIWYATQKETHPDKGKPVIFMVNQVISGFANLRNETLMFVAANVFGIGIASVIPTDNMLLLIDVILPWVDLRIAFITFIFLFFGFVGLHPIIVVLSLSAILSPEIIGLRDWVLALTYLGCWGLATMISPYSGTTLFMSRYTGVPSYTIGWKWSLYSVCFNAVLMDVFIITLRHSTL
ncbi:MAG TPA: hypothetical protein EYQ26_16200 [Rhodospirillales bacterium]|nr:hypothetical protein [Rhodospirillales bacterium]